MKLAMLFAFVPLLVAPLLPLVPAGGRRWLPPLAALLPVAALVPAGALDLSWVMLGAGTIPGMPGAVAVALLAPCFALALWRRGDGKGPGGSACLLLAQGALGAALVASDLLLLLAGFTLATYSLLAARLGDGAGAPGRLPAVIAVLVLGDLAAFELALLLAKATGNAVVPTVAGAAGALSASPVVAAFAALSAGSRGALLLLAGYRSAAALLLAALPLLAVPLLGWRLGGAHAAVAAVVAVAAFALLAAGLAPLLSRLLPPLVAKLTAWEASAFGLPARRAGGEPSAEHPRRGLASGLGALELAVGSWRTALAATVLLALLLLAATLR
ncbi:hypothetical protein [Pseudohaliea sp.]|uniref:hypothetical protein n=1 Tax=Pseudohaliea sp. TaxID=2740289 RepID=UPI0032EE59E7